jgi:ABC-type amino acid transport system permease subunit
MGKLDWSVFFTELPGGGEEYWQLLLYGLRWTLALSAASWVLALVIGTIVGTIRATPGWSSSGTSRSSCRCSSGIS